MNPIIYPSTETAFTTRGYGALADCVSCSVTEVINGEYSLTMKYPKNGIHQEYLQVGNIIVCKPNKTTDRDAFRINKVSRAMQDYITVTAYQLSYDLTGYPVTPFSASDIDEAIDGLDDVSGGFTIATDIDSEAPFVVNVPSSVRSWFGGKEGSLIDVYGGEWEFNFWNCNLSERRGSDNGVRISYGVNLSKYVKESSFTAYSHILPYFFRQDGDDDICVIGDEITVDANNLQRTLILDVTDKFSTACGQYIKGKLNSKNRSFASMTGNTYTDISDSVVYRGVNATYPALPTQASTNLPTLVMIENEDAGYRNISLTAQTARIGVAVPIQATPNMSYEITWDRASLMYLTLQYVNTSGVVQSYNSEGALDTLGGSIIFTVPSNATYFVLLFYAMSTSGIIYVNGLRIKSVPTTDEVTDQGQLYLDAHSELASNNNVISASPEVLAVDVDMGDTVHVVYDNAIVDSRIVKTTWDVLAERYTALEIGNVKQSIAQTIKSLR